MLSRGRGVALVATLTILTDFAVAGVSAGEGQNPSLVAVGPRRIRRSGAESGPSSRGSLRSDSAPASRFDRRFYVFRVLAPEP